ncbi:MAG: RIP metalloprotease RseP [Bacillota bacterium]
MTILLSVLIFGLLILAHELGHFAVAKFVGIRVEEFSIGLGPKVFSTRRGETLYSLRVLPLGGFNRMAGMDEDDSNDEHSFNRKSISNRMAVIFAGSMMNFVLAVILFIVVFMVIGMPSHSTVVGKVSSGKPAETAGLQPGDQIIAVDGDKVENWGQLVEKIHAKPSEELNMTVKREGSNRVIRVIPFKDPQSGKGMIGIEQAWVRLGMLDSIGMGIKETAGVLKLIVAGLIKMVTGEVAAEVTGPVGIVQLIGEAAKFGLATVFNFAAILSLHLGLINLFPIPALDGSRMVFLAVEGVRGKPLDREKENFVHFIGFALLMILMLIITYKDLIRILG